MSGIQANLRDVEARIQAACERSGRRREEITLIAVSKTKPLSDVEEAMSCGMSVFGENKVQEMMDKQEQLSARRERGELSEDILNVAPEWHMIGHLQTNKVKYLMGRTALIHSVDSLRLAEAIERESEKAGVVTPILLEINMAGENSKFGLLPEQTEELARKISAFSHVKLRGLMTVAPFTEDPEENRQYFRQMRKLLIDINSKNIDNVTMDVLSMGMTGDYEIAVEEGATCIRVGTGIFGVRNYTTA